MKTHPVMDVSGLSVYNNWTRAPLWWGFMGMIAIEATVFTSFIVSYFYLGAGHSSWPPLSHEPPKLLLPTINTIILVASSFVVHWGDRGIKAGEPRRLAVACGFFGATLVLLDTSVDGSPAALAMVSSGTASAHSTPSR